MSQGQYVAYYRVSTGHQEVSGLGLDAQREAVSAFIGANHGTLVAEFSETISGRKRDRPALLEAARICRVFRAVLVIARLDRLARNVEMILTLMESGLDFVAVDFPYANRFTIHVLAAVAEYESKLNSERVKSALAEARRRGVKLGRRRGDVDCRFPPNCQRASCLARSKNALSRARDLAPVIWKMKNGAKSYREIAEELNRLGIPASRGGQWCRSAVVRTIERTRSEFGKSPDAEAASPGSTRLKVLQNDREIGPLLVQLRVSGMTLARIAHELHCRGIKAPRAARWALKTVGRYLKRAMGVSSLHPLRRDAR